MSEIMRPLTERLNSGGIARLGPLLLICAMTITRPLHGAPLNDTGITLGGDYSPDNNADCSSNIAAAQDCHQGRDAAAAGVLTKVGGGSDGFDFTKICNSGEAAGEGSCPANDDPGMASIGSGANQWACTRDNVTGLVWEVKTNDDGLRDQDWTYTWYDSVNNWGDYAGTASGGHCFQVGRCDSERYVDDVNAAGMCGYSDWRMPTRQELVGILDLSRAGPSIDGDYFPNTLLSDFWSGSPVAAKNSSSAWHVHFNYGFANVNYRGFAMSVRLVRGGQ